MRFMPTILLFIFYVMSFCSSTTVLVLNRQVLVYQFNSLLVSCNIFSCFLSNSPRDYTNILIYNNLVWVNTNFISIICKIFVLCSPLSPLCCIIKQMTYLNIMSTQIIIIALCRYLLNQIRETKSYKQKIYIMFCIYLLWQTE